MIPFVKMHGLGNSYIYFDCFLHHLDDMPLAQLAKTVSDPCFGIGSDGMILMGPSKIADVKMRIFNKDGSEAKTCGNGLRCVARLAFERGYAKTTTFYIETLSGIVEASIENEKVSINLGEPNLKRKQIPMLGKSEDLVISEPFSINDQELAITAVSMGNPHAVFFTSSLDEMPHQLFGPDIECDRRFPEKVNVEFALVESPKKIHMRVWERGSGITKACGTGAAAVAVAAVLNGFSKQDAVISVHLEGGVLDLVWQKDGCVKMTGPAAVIASGNFLPPVFESPEKTE